uniref:Cation/H(+) antiporter 20 n=1 Tax=Anthurium amnicola TaxID=1678845 RepID=A0A1D1Z6R0_9ARAE
MAPVNITSIKTSSNGVWQGDDPLHFAFPLLILQTIIVLLLSRSLYFLLKPLRQPKVIAEIVGGILLGPSAMGRNEDYLHTVFPKWSMPILETAASIGLLFFLFLVGLELDLASIRRSGRRALSIAAAGISLPFACGAGVSLVLRRAVPGADQAGYAPFVVFMGVALSITAFPVLARILAELKVLTTPLGETAMAAAAFNDIAAWVLLALAVALSGSGGDTHKSPLISLWVLLCGAAFVGFMMAAVRPLMSWVARRASSEGEGELWTCLTLAGVLASGFVTDLIGIHAIFGAFVFGLTVPKGGEGEEEFAGRLIERIEDFVSGLLLPLYFASSGLKTDVTKMQGGRAWVLLALVVATACLGKILGTFAAAVACRMPGREALTLGVLMNTKGLVELIVLNIGKERKVLNDETFAILVLMALFTTFITTPTVMAIYKPARAGGRAAYSKRKLQRELSGEAPAAAKELRLLACVRGPRDAPAVINLVETIRGGTRKSPLKLYILRLVELTERSSSIVMALGARRNGLPFRNPLKRDSCDRVLVAFEAYGQLGRVRVRPMTAISAMPTMHDDVCSVAEDKQVALLVLPFHRHGRGGGAMEDAGHGWRAVNQRVMKAAPCSVAVLVDRGLGGGEQVGSAEVSRGVCVVFFGGPDDREALELAGRMAEHPGIKVAAVRFVVAGSSSTPGKKGPAVAVSLRPSPHKSTEENYTFSTATVDRQREKELDEAAVAEFRTRTEGTGSVYEERPAENVVDAVLALGRSGEFELVVVGKGRFPSSIVAGLAGRSAEHAELGPVGDALASSGHGVVSSVLVIQQHDVVHSEETPVSVVFDPVDASNHNSTSNPV